MKDNLFEKLFPWVFGITFATVFVLVISTFAFNAYVGYRMATETGYAGRVIGENVKTFIDEIKK